MKTITFQISEEQEHELRGGRLAYLELNDAGEISMEWCYKEEAFDKPFTRKTILFGRITAGIH